MKTNAFKANAWEAVSVSLRPACSTEGSPGQPGLLSKTLFKKQTNHWGWRDGSAIKSTCSCRRPEFNAQAPTWWLTTVPNSSSRWSIALLFWPRASAMYLVHRHSTYRQNIYIQKKKMEKKKKRKKGRGWRDDSSEIKYLQKMSNKNLSPSQVWNCISLQFQYFGAGKDFIFKKTLSQMKKIQVYKTNKSLKLNSKKTTWLKTGAN